RIGVEQTRAIFLRAAFVPVDVVTYQARLVHRGLRIWERNKALLEPHRAWTNRVGSQPHPRRDFAVSPPPEAREKKPIWRLAGKLCRFVEGNEVIVGG